MTRIVLASASPRRRELLRRIGLTDFTVRVPQVEETCPAGLSPEETVVHISREKSLAVESAPDEIVITADTMVFLDNKRLGKPADEAEALSMLRALQGRRHTVCTGVTVRQGDCAVSRTRSTDVWFRHVGDDELRAYIAGGEPLDKAGAYGVQGQGALLVERIDGDFFNVMGLPVELLAQMLRHFGVILLGNPDTVREA
ncbi:MAG: septum formation protein Maf [Oscillospiraceae bacterium]|nr:septum formation protein Maf [Oscillospiraceae bacterium]